MPTISYPGLLRLLQRRINQAGGVRAFGRLHACSAPYVSDVKLGRRMPGPKMLRALGYEAAESTAGPFRYRKVLHAR